MQAVTPVPQEATTAESSVTPAAWKAAFISSVGRYLRNEKEKIIACVEPYYEAQYSLEVISRLIYII
jgi:hypothetical protein